MKKFLYCVALLGLILVLSKTEGFAAVHGEIDVSTLQSLGTYTYYENGSYGEGKDYPLYKCSYSYAELTQFDCEYISDDGNIVMVTHDRVATSAKRRIGIRAMTITRTVQGTTNIDPSLQYIEYLCDEFDSYEGDPAQNREICVLLSSDGIYTWQSIHMVSLTDAISKMRTKGYTEWASEVEERYFNGGAVPTYLKLDDVLVDRDLGNSAYIYKKYSSGDCKQTGSGIAHYGTCYANLPSDNNVYRDAIAGIFGSRLI